MKKIDLKIRYVSKLMGDKINPPQYKTEGSAGMDLSACMEESVTLKPGQRAIIPTGIAIEIPDENFVGLVFARSGLGIKHGITLSNSVGVIDSDYRGEIKCGVVNLGEEEYTIEPGDRISQLIIMPVTIANIIPSETLNDTQRGSGGLGSTGVK